MRKLDRIKVSGYKSLREVDVELRDLNILIGANASGKSNFISLFRFLNEYIEKRLQTYIKVSGGAESILFFGSKTTKTIGIRLTFGSNELALDLQPTADDQLVITNETPYFRGHGYPRRFLYRTEHTPFKTHVPYTEKRAEKHFYGAIRSWKLYHFHDTSESSPMKKPCEISDNLYFRQNGENLSAFLYRLKNSKGKFAINVENYNNIRDIVRLVFPAFDDFLLIPDPLAENKIRLQWAEKNSDYPFQAYHFSDGTLRFICLATLLLQPSPPATIVIDEPELGLHPYAIELLASMLKSAATGSTGSQIIVSTQSVTLLNHFQPEDIIVVEREDNETKLKRLNSEELKEWIGDYSIGELWEKNLIGGRP